MLDNYPERKPQVKIVNHDTNKGVAIARYTGYKESSGEYLIYCDPDDWIEKEYYAEILSFAQTSNIDIVISDYYKDTENRSFYIQQKPEALTAESIIDQICGTVLPILHGSLWNKLIRRTCLDNICFPSGISYCEDACMIIQALCHAEKIGYLPKAYYHYVERSQSLSKAGGNKYLSHDNKLMDFLYEILEGSNIDNWRNDWLSYSLSIIINRSFISGKLSDSEFKSLIAPFADGIKCNKRLNKCHKLALRIAISVNYHLGLFLWKVMNKLKL